jgi:NodT family efflux transporter outer membrane factor (OMF) lipoprotein
VIALPRIPSQVLLFLVAACSAVGPDYHPPAAAVPDAFRETGAVLVNATPDLAQWWHRLDDAVLDGLVEQATRQNLDFREALERVAEARALRGGAEAELWPTVDASAAYRRLGDSKNTPLGGLAVDSNSYVTGLDASWEIDLWGRVRRGIEAADADLEATRETARAVLVTVAAETAANYVQLRALQERLAIARNNIDLQERTLALVRTRFESGLVGERDVAQAASNLAALRARVPAIETDLRAAENRLAVLLGLPPGALAADLAQPSRIPVPPAEVAVGVPADVVRRRPDVRSAERALAAETARIGVAEGDLYPQLTLFGSVGFSADHAARLFDGDSNVLAIGPTLRWNLFDAGRVRNRIAAQDARARQALVRWQRAVLAALEEAENAMAAFVREQTRAARLGEAATEARRAVEFAQTQYREGLTDFQNVLDSERVVADLEDQVAQSHALITADLIALYKALGGGWESE